MKLSGELAKTLLELAPDATVVVDAAGTIVFANAEVERTFGYAPNELAGEPVENLLPARFRGAHSEHRARFGVRPKPRSMGEGLTLFGQHKSGREFHVEISLSPVQSDDGLLVVASIRDATVRHDTERGLIEANRAKSRLLAAASHDLRQPVQTLNLLNQAAARHAGANTALKNVLEHQQAALDTMSALLASVLDVSKLDSGAVARVVVDCAINDVFDRLRSDFAPLAEDKGLSLIVEPTAEGARTDPELLRRMLGNLLSNGIRYTQAGSVQVSCRGAGDELTITVRDTGAGIAADELGKVFDEFYQVDRGPRRPEGLGLGLSIVRRLAGLLDHKIGMESVVDQGTAFTIRVPRVTLAATAAREAGTAATTSARGKILVVDDEPSVAHATSLLLELEGFDVRIASCKSEALERVRADAPDLIISDFHLRGLETGADVVAEVRTELGALIPAIFVTGDTSRLAATGAKLHNTSLLSKPTRAEELLSAIREHIGGANIANSTSE
jgi:PAS domain S-box-containing protein